MLLAEFIREIMQCLDARRLHLQKMKRARSENSEVARAYQIGGRSATLCIYIIGKYENIVTNSFNYRLWCLDARKLHLQKIKSREIPSSFKDHFDFNHEEDTPVKYSFIGTVKYSWAYQIW